MAEDLFLGRIVDEKTGGTGSEPLMLSPADLTTHGLIVGMTGSGKTALGIVMIEELLRRGTPVLAIDPKGDLGNLLLDFPGLSPAEFAPWVEPGTGATPESEAKRWSDGLAGWGLGPTDVAALGASREAVIFTPGSKAGTPLDLLGSCAAPASDDEEDRNDVSSAFLTGLLGLAGIEADPIRSKELILLSLCVEAIWQKGETATVEALVKAAAAPPFSTVGALPLETFYPAKDRQQLVFALNNVLASPASAAFRTGAPLDVASWLEPQAPGGKTRLSIVSIAHLSDAERVFVVSTILSRVKAWMRTQPGRSTLGALVYIDEIFGFFPPSAEPPTKRPLLTLLKQARAFGVGVVLATQNPVDLDYKGLANCGCWWVGTLQTERDRARLAEGLSDASGSRNSREVARLLDGTRKRVFLLHDIHRREPVLLETRWAMSYLRGPMTREEIARLKSTAPSPDSPSRADPSTGPARAEASGPPPGPASWPARWVAKRGADIASPYLFVRYAVRYRLDKAAADESEGLKLFPLAAGAPGEVLEGDPVDVTADELLSTPPDRLRSLPALNYEALPEWLGPRSVPVVEKAVKERLPDKLKATLLRDPVTGALSMPSESPQGFAARLAGASAPVAPAVLRERLEKKRRELAVAEEQEKGRSMETYASMAGAALDVLGGLLGKRKSLRVSKVSSVLSKKRMEGAAESKAETLRAEIAELEAKVAPPDPSRFETVDIVPAKAHVDVLSIGVAWVV